MEKPRNKKVKFSGDLLNIRRKTLGLSQGDVAKAIGVSKMAVHHWEIGRFQPYPKHIPLIATVLKMNATSLLLHVK